MVDPERRAHAGVLRPEAARRRIDLAHEAPEPGLATYVDYLWRVAWEVDGEHVQEVIPRPAVQVVAERVDGVPRLLVHGVMTARFERRLAGADRAVGLAFRPGGFHPLLRGAVSALTDRSLDLDDLLPPSTPRPALAASLLDPGLDPASAGRLLADRLLATAPEPDPVATELGDLVETCERDRDLTRAEQLARLAGVSLRTLQRRFEEYVGVGPKWVVHRCRLLDAAAAAHDDGPVDWAELAATLGFADQSHLIRGFTALVGHPPATYARRDDVHGLQF